MSNEMSRDRNKFIFVCIDVYSRFVMCVPLKNKSEIECSNALRMILKEIARRRFTVEQLDSVIERAAFLSKSLSKYFKNQTYNS